MAITQNTYTGNGSTVLYSFTFPYLETTDIKVSLDGTVTTAYTLANATTIQFNTAPANGVAIRIYRQTDDAALAAQFYAGSAIRSQDLNDNFTQNLYVTQESNRDATQAITTADAATATANTALSNSTAAVSTANTASANASAAVSTANTASSNASAAVATANTASSNATTAVNTANAATATANSAASDAATAISTANSAVNTANTATTNATNAVNTANAASASAASAVSTANTASTNASNAVATANTASTNATTAVNTANSAEATANSAAAAVANAVIYTIVANVAAIPGSPANNTAIEVADSTGIESFTPLANLPAGFVGNSGLSVRIIYATAGSTWNWVQYFPNDPEARYLKLAGGTVTGNLEVSGSLTKSNNNVVTVGDTGTVTSTMIADGTIVDADVNASAAIAGTKISPNFGSQNVTTTGTSTAASFTPTSSTVPTNGVYLPAANSVALSTNGQGRLFVNATGGVGVGTIPETTFHIGNSVNSIFMDRNEGVVGGPNAVFRKSRGTSVSPVVVSSSDFLGALQFTGYDGTSYPQAAIVRGEVDGAVSTNNVPGRIVFFTSNGGSATERLRITSAGLVGIGTSSPGYLLHVAGSTLFGANATGVASRFSSANNTQLMIYSDTANQVNIEAFQADSPNTKYSIYFNKYGGNSFFGNRVGIGTTSPPSPLSVTGTWVANRGIVNIDAASGTQFTGLVATSNLSPRIFLYNDNTASQTFLEHRGTGALTINAFDSAPVTFQTANTERARIDSSGRLLVGTSSAFGTGAFQVTGGGINLGTYTNNAFSSGIDLIKSRSTTAGQFTIVQSGDELGGIAFRGTDGSAIKTAATIYGVVDGTPGLNDMPGRLVFSTTADGASNPTERMRINSTGGIFSIGTANTITTSTTQAAGTSFNLFIGKHSGTDGVVNSGTISINIASNGNIVNTNNSYGAISDIKLKENIVDAGSQWADIKALQVRKYNFKEGQTHTQIGLVAQEAELVSPGLVSESPDRDAEGNDLGTVTKSVNYSVLYMKAVKALQEAMERIETLEAKVAALESA